MTKSLAFLAACLLIFTHLAQSAPANEVGKVISVEGEAYVTHKFKKEKLKVGEPVYGKDKFQTKKDAKVVIDMNGASTITIGPDTRFNMKKKLSGGDSKTKLSLFSGSVKCKVKKLGENQSFSVKTPSAVAGVRGTEFESVMDPATMNSATVTTEGTTWNAAPENEAMLDKALEQAKAQDGGGPAPSGGPGPGSDVIKVVGANEAAIFLPDGTGLVTEMDPKSSVPVTAILKKMANDLDVGKVESFLNEQQDQLDQELAERLQTLEERLTTIEEARAAEELPGPPTSPNNN